MHLGSLIKFSSAPLNPTYIFSSSLKVFDLQLLVLILDLVSITNICNTVLFYDEMLPWAFLRLHIIMRAAQNLSVKLVHNAH